MASKNALTLGQFRLLRHICDTDVALSVTTPHYFA